VYEKFRETAGASVVAPAVSRAPSSADPLQLARQVSSPNPGKLGTPLLPRGLVQPCDEPIGIEHVRRTILIGAERALTRGGMMVGSYNGVRLQTCGRELY